MKEKLSDYNRKQIKRLDNAIKEISNIKDKLTKYQLGDFYLSESFDSIEPNIKYLDKTALGFPVKYEVVAISECGIPYLRQCSAKGHVGELIIPPELKILAALEDYATRMSNVNEAMVDWRGRTYLRQFIPDPDQYDAILLQKEFNPVEQQIEAAKLRNEIKKYNKSITIQTSGSGGYNAIANFFKAAKPGDVFWTAPNKHFVIQSVVKQGREWCVTVTDINQQTHTSNFNSFMYTRLYKAQPRSFTQEAKK